MGRKATPHQRRSLVPSERQQHREVDPLIRRSRRTTSGSAGSGADTSIRWASPTNRHHIEPPRSIGTINSPFRENARRPNRSFKNDESGRSSISLHPRFSTLGGRANEPTSQPKHATNAGSRRHAETISTLRTIVTHR